VYQKLVVIICGPTAVGKTAVAVELAQQFGTEIISADSRQCFKELNIGVAKPSEMQLSAVPHHFINSHSIHDDVNAGIFENYALQAAEKIFQHQPVAIMVGGTGLYIKAFTDGMDMMPEVNLDLRKKITKSYEKNGLEYLQMQVAKKRPCVLGSCRTGKSPAAYASP
jgi:tRNA dimethylallyltransferase